LILDENGFYGPKARVIPAQGNALGSDLFADHRFLMGLDSTVDTQPTTTILANDGLKSSFYILNRKVLNEEHRLAKEVVTSLVVHAPKDIVRGRNNDGVPPPVFEDDINVNVSFSGFTLDQSDT
jgi:predicted oxidoreductase